MLPSPSNKQSHRIKHKKFAFIIGVWEDQEKYYCPVFGISLVFSGVGILEDESGGKKGIKRPDDRTVKENLGIGSN